MAEWKLHSWTITYDYPEECRTINAILEAGLRYLHPFNRGPYNGLVLELRGELIRVKVVPWKSNTLQVRYASPNGSQMLRPLEQLLGEADTESVYSQDLVINMI